MNPWVTRVREHLERRLDEPQLIEHVADAMCLSSVALSNRFVEATGIRPEDYLHYLRLARAKLLLERTFLSVPQVAMAVGLEDGSDFEDEFCRVHGATPREIRERAWRTCNHHGSCDPTFGLTDRRRSRRP